MIRTARHSGFTLIEILVVITIVMVLMAMLLAAASLVRSRAKDVANASRIQNISTAMTALGSESGAANRIMAQAMGVYHSYGSLRDVLTYRMRTYGTDFADSGQKRPPGIKIETAYFAEEAGSKSLDERVHFLRRYEKGAKVYDSYDRMDDEDDPRRSPLGETLDRTMEVYPLANWEPAGYRAFWPNLIETPRGTTPETYDQTCWPASDWESDGTIPPLFTWPWGKPIISRATGNSVPHQKEQRHLGQLSPRYTINLLVMAGIVPDAATYRQDRGPDQPWNDIWGNPLVVASAAFLPPRYDFEDTSWKNGAPYAPGVEISREMHGGRDYLLRKARESYGFGRAVYVAVAAAGPQLATPLPAAWTEADDAVALRQLWTQVRDTCDASDWDQDAWGEPAWSGIRAEDGAGRIRCHLGTPLEIQ